MAFKLHVDRLGDGPGPSEVIIGITTADGSKEEVIVDHISLKDDNLTIGYPIAEKENSLLIELPRETMRGLWRIWVPTSSLKKAMA